MKVLGSNEHKLVRQSSAIVEWVSIRHGTTEQLSESPSSKMAIEMQSRQRGTAAAAVSIECHPDVDEVLNVNVEICSTSATAGLFVVTCAIEDAAACTRAHSGHTESESGSTRRYSFTYSHKRGSPRTVGLSGGMLDLASQTPLGTEHSWRIRTKGSRRNFRYEIEVKREAAHAELIVDGQTEHLSLPWMSIEEEECESTSRKADGHTEKMQQCSSDSSEKKNNRLQLPLKRRKRIERSTRAASDVDVVCSSSQPTRFHQHPRFPGTTATTPPMRMATLSTITTQASPGGARLMPTPFSTWSASSAGTSTFLLSSNNSLSPVNWQGYKPGPLSPTLKSGGLRALMQKTSRKRSARKAIFSWHGTAQQGIYEGLRKRFEYEHECEPSMDVQPIEESAETSDSVQLAYLMEDPPPTAIPVSRQDISTRNLFREIDLYEYCDIEINSTFSCNANPFLAMRTSEEKLLLLLSKHQAGSMVNLSKQLKLQRDSCLMNGHVISVPMNVFQTYLKKRLLFSHLNR